jgi:hypothetical protein
MKNESYKNNFDRLTAMMERNKESLAPGEYDALESETFQTITGGVEYTQRESGLSEARAYELAYEGRGRDLRFEWLRKNSDAPQGFYGRADMAPLVMSIEKSGGIDEYTVEIELGLNEEPYLVSFKGIGTQSKFSAALMTVPYEDDENAVTIAFDAESATVTTSQTFKDKHPLCKFDWVTIDGTYEIGK